MDNTAPRPPADLCGDGALTIPNACAFTGIGRSTLYNLMRDGTLTPIRVGGRTLLARRQLVELLARGIDAAA